MTRQIKFRACAGFPKYEVSNNGSIYSLDYNNTGQRRMMKQYLNEDGYPYVYFVVGGKRHKKIAHRLVAKAFVPEIAGKVQVNHKNGKRTDNRAENLEWVTSSENTLHGWRVNGRKFSEKAREMSRQKMVKINKIKYAKTN